MSETMRLFFFTSLIVPVTKYIVGSQLTLAQLKVLLLGSKIHVL
jgi:hypothetical protein